MNGYRPLSCKSLKLETYIYNLSKKATNFNSTENKYKQNFEIGPMVIPSFRYCRNWILFVLLLMAAPVWAQPDPAKFFSFNLYFTLPSEMEAQFEYGNIDMKDFEIECQYYYRGYSFPPSEEHRSIFFHKASFDAPAQISLSDMFLTFAGARAFDSIAVRFQWNEKIYATTVLPALENASYGCICDFGNKYKRLAPNNCKTQTTYINGRPESRKLKFLIEQRKNRNKSQRRAHASNSQFLRIVNSDMRVLYPLVIANGDTCDIMEGQGIDAIILPFSWENQKIQLEIFHPDYPSLLLDSVSRFGYDSRDYIYLLREDEDYFLDGGRRIPLVNGYRELAFWFDPSTSDTSINAIVHRLTTKNKLKLSKDWKKSLQLEKDSLGSDYVNSKYGSFNAHLEHVLYFKGNLDFDYNFAYDFVEDHAEIYNVSIPVSYYKYLVPRLTIQFKHGLSEVEIEKFENHFLPKFERINFDNYQVKINLTQRTYQFPNWIFVPNYLQEKIMKDPRVRYCGEAFYEHILTE